MDVKGILKQYRSSKATIAYAARDTQETICQHPETAEDAIEGLSLPAPSLSHLSSRNKVSDNVPRIAEQYKYEMQPDRAREKEQERDNNSRKEDKLRQAKDIVYMVEQVIYQACTLEEKFIMECVYVDGYSWRQTEDIYATTYGRDLGGSMLRKICREAIWKIDKIVT